MKMYLPLIVLGVGVSLVVLSFLWPRMVRKAVWSEEQATERSQAGGHLHALMHARVHSKARGNSHEEGHGEHGTAGPTAEEIEAARQRFDRTTEGLDKARARREGTARLLKWAGGICSLLGAAGYFILMRSAGG